MEKRKIVEEMILTQGLVLLQTSREGWEDKMVVDFVLIL
jgi:hypothetical protein